MAKYIKHYYVQYDNPTEFLIYNNQSRNGRMHPPLAELDVKVWCGEPSSVDYCLSVVPDTTHVPSVNGIQVLTFTEWAAEAESYFNLIKGNSQVTFDASLVETIEQSFNTLYLSAENI